jgi:cytochrome c biogenesis protein CcmG/thiol:disulfide interchange protein DsbE
VDSSTARTRAALALLVILLASGIAIAARLVLHHEVQVYGDATAALLNCPQTETINCEVVNTSPWSELWGVPIAAFALPTYLLVLGLILAGSRRDAFLSYAFCIGLLSVLYSGFLFWVSKTQIGYLCLWCMGLYGVNLSVPVLVGVAAWRPPLSHVRRTLRDLATWPNTLRLTTAGFVILLAGTIAAQQAYRSEVRRAAAEERARIEEQGGPLIPAVPPQGDESGATPAPDRTDEAPPAESRKPGGKSSGLTGLTGSPQREDGSGWVQFASILPVPTSLLALMDATPTPARNSPAPAASPATASPPQTGGPYRLAGPLRKVSGTGLKLLAAAFDLQGRLGRGKPVALIFWAPGFPDSERELVRMAAFLRRETPQIETYAVSGRRDDQQDAEIWERFAMLDLPPDLPLLLDDKFVVSEALTTLDVPDLALFDGKGSLVVAKIKNLSQLLMSSAGRVTAETVVRQVASGAAVEQIKNMFPFYPSADLLGACAPAFTAKTFGTGAPYDFTGRSPSRKPTLVMFWSSTCKHCQQEIPQMVEWMKKNPGVVDLVSVTHLKRKDGSDAAHRAVTESYIKIKHIPWIVLEDPDNAIAELYRSVSTPTTYVVSASGRIVDIWYYAHEGNFRQVLEASLAKARSAPGCEAPPRAPAARLAFSMTGPDGKRLQLASLLDRPAIVHFWATWCAPCVEELPSLLRFRDRVEREGTARVILVSVEGEEAGAKIAAFQKKLGVDLRSYRAPTGGLAQKLDLAYRVPRTYLVAPGGDVLALRQGNQNWDDPGVMERTRSRLAVLGNAGHPPGAGSERARAGSR